MNLSSDPAVRLVQLQTIKAYVEANHTANGSGVYSDATATEMNKNATPDFWVFKSEVTTDAISDVVDWAELLTGSPLSAAERWAFDRILHNGTIDPSLVNIREGLSEIFGGQPNTRNAILSESTRLATIAESILSSDATGTPGGGNGSVMGQSAVMGDGAEGDITEAILIEASGVALP